MTDTIVYICTVGTGTLGKSSNVGQGIVNAIRQRSPDVLYLVPSSSQDSEMLADLIADETGAARYSEAQRHFALSNHDALLSSRDEFRQLLKVLRDRHPGARLMINPTSGTKQMTTAAVLAAIDEGIGELDYITGPRADGVVQTGQEAVTPVSGERILAEIVNRQAIALLHAGSYNGAETLLKPHADLLPDSLIAARVLGAWDRFNYGDAHYHCPRGEAWTDAYRILQVLKDARHPELIHLADMMQAARRWLEQNRAEEALARLYRIFEAAGKLALKRLGVDEPYHADDMITKCSVSAAVARKLRHWEKGNDGELHLGVMQVAEILGSQVMLVEEVWRNKVLRSTLQYRNRTVYGHGIEQVASSDVRELFDAIYHALAADLPAFPDDFQRCRFPDINLVVNTEIDV